MTHEIPPGAVPWEGLLDEAERALGAGRMHDALQLCDRAALAGEEARYHAALLRGDVLLQMGDAAGALSSFESIADPARADPEVDLARGIALFELSRLPEAENALRSAVRGNPDIGEAWYTLALIAELQGTGEEVELFRKARRLEPERYRPPRQLSRAEFEQIVEKAVAELPERVRHATRDIPVLVAELPHPDDLLRADPPIPPTALGMFVGVPPGQLSVMDGPDSEPPAILLFKRNLERAFPDEDQLVEELRKTVLHEIGHALGLSELDLHRRGLE